MAIDPYDVGEDPYQYWGNPEDAKRLNHLQHFLGDANPTLTADVGCGEGFITEHLPGKEIYAFEKSRAALDTFRGRMSKTKRNSLGTIHYVNWNVFDAPPLENKFDLVIITGLLYPHLLESAGNLAVENICKLGRRGATYISVHVSEWGSFAPPLDLIDEHMYSYRNQVHKIEVFRK